MGGAIPGALLYVNEPLTAWNFASPQGVMGGRSPLRGAFPRGTLPLTQIPVRSCGSKACVLAAWALGAPDGCAFWANVTDDKVSAATTTTTERIGRFCTLGFPSIVYVLPSDFVCQSLPLPAEPARRPQLTTCYLSESSPSLFSTFSTTRSLRSLFILVLLVAHNLESNATFDRRRIIRLRKSRRACLPFRG